MKAGALGNSLPSGDLDLLAYGSPEPAIMRNVISEICGTAVADDGLEFDADSIAVEPVREEDKWYGTCAIWKK